jgi:hypothetical protein
MKWEKAHFEKKDGGVKTPPYQTVALGLLSSRALSSAATDEIITA